MASSSRPSARSASSSGATASRRRIRREHGFPCIHYGQIYTFYGTSTHDDEVVRDTRARDVGLKQAQPGDLVITTTSENIEDVCTAVAWLGEGPIAIGGHSCVFKHTLDPMYAAYYFQTDQISRMQKRRVRHTDEGQGHQGVRHWRIQIPVPPPAVQREIAAILDKMEMLKPNLRPSLKPSLNTAPASMRITATRSSHLTRKAVCLGRLWATSASSFAGERFTKNDIVSDGIACINFGEMYTHYGAFADEAVSRVRKDLARSLRFASKVTSYSSR